MSQNNPDQPNKYDKFLDKPGQDPFEIEAQIRMNNVEGFGAVADPDRALRELGKKEAARLHDPQQSDAYQKAEFAPLIDAMDAALKDDYISRGDLGHIALQHSAGITNNNDGSHTLDWEYGINTPPLTITDYGHVIEKDQH